MNKRVLDHLPTIALIASLIFVAFELRQNPTDDRVEFCSKKIFLLDVQCL